ncbi:MAG TPA: SIMPL domain-containing protein, partial [Bryobacteraceae bacterium]|nr:SIMPL domain-containing protein [Bryobacteraceae bacterium]
MRDGVYSAGLILLMFGGANSSTAQRVSIDAGVRMTDKPYIQVTGEATVSAKPDQAFIEIGVITQG